ncbi:MAG: IS110 family transposase [Actinobacteria bacterium]|nr:IS110 family transposase [Actinomycetota bacterium]
MIRSCPLSLAGSSRSRPCWCAARRSSLRGIDPLSALGLCAEVGDFERFARPARLMSYLGLAPSQDSSGERGRQGSITKSGSRHARRLLVEAAWHYPRAPRKGRDLRRAWLAVQ